MFGKKNYRSKDNLLRCPMTIENYKIKLKRFEVWEFISTHAVLNRTLLKEIGGKVLLAVCHIVLSPRTFS